MSECECMRTDDGRKQRKQHVDIGARYAPTQRDIAYITYLNDPDVASDDHSALKRGTSNVGAASFLSSAILRAVSAASNSSSLSRSSRNLSGKVGRWEGGRLKGIGGLEDVHG